jgi:hypothetical protein
MHVEQKEAAGIASPQNAEASPLQPITLSQTSLELCGGLACEEPGSMEHFLVFRGVNSDTDPAINVKL